MTNTVRDALVGAVLAVAAVLGVQQATENSAPPTPIETQTPAAVPEGTQTPAWACPDASWTRGKDGYAADAGSAFAICKKNDVTIRHFYVKPINMESQDQGIDDRTLEPLSLADAIKLANSR